MNRNYIMTGYQKHIVISLILIFILAVFGCKEKEIPPTIVAKVGDRVLTEENLDSLLLFTNNKNKYKEEVVRDWVDSEILQLESREKGIFATQEYLELVNESNKRIAIALYLRQLLNEQENNMDEVVLRNYYEQNKDELYISNKAFVFNRASFSDETKAIQFRSTLIESDWNKTVNVFSGDKSIVEFTTEKFSYDYQIISNQVRIVLNNLEESETSIIFETQPGNFNIVQLIRVFDPNSIPDYEYIKDYVKQRYFAMINSQKYDELIQDLYSKYDVIINR
ncbi:MAG: peptidylprolyl isomerase [Melioribacteraceae bacterium]|nr:MAG: peptidylprolyl isomerase [Melioribacteraceae bacterium]